MINWDPGGRKSACTFSNFPIKNPPPRPTICHMGVHDEFKQNRNNLKLH